MADSLRRDGLGCYGGPSTPVVDRIAGESTLFERAVAAAPWTVPAVASLMTGVYSHRLGLVKWEQPWPSEHQSLFALAARAGYRVASFVFDAGHLFCRVPAARVQGSSQDTAALLAWLFEHRHEPFLLFVHYWWTHIPYVARPMTVRQWQRVTEPVLAALRAGPSARAGVRRLYEHSVRYFSEEWLRALLEAVDLERTWLVLTADHGESWGDGGRPAGSHGDGSGICDEPPVERSKPSFDRVGRVRDVFDLHGNSLGDEVLGVPLLLRPPGGGNGHRIAGTVRSVDLVPTLAELMGLPGPDGVDGVSLAECVRAGAPAPAGDAVSVRSGDFVDSPTIPDDPRNVWCELALTSGRLKLLWRHQTDSRRVFDLLRDPHERTNIVAAVRTASPERLLGRPGIASADLEAGWDRLRAELARARVAPWLDSDRERVGERLRLLGYLSDVVLSCPAGAPRCAQTDDTPPASLPRPQPTERQQQAPVGERSIHVVSGLPRSGTSMMMAMLAAGGLEVATDNSRMPDEDNPRGYFELEAARRIEQDATWLAGIQQKAVKLVSPLLVHLPAAYRYKVIFVRRDLDEIVASQKTMLVRRRRPDTGPQQRQVPAWHDWSVPTTAAGDDDDDDDDARLKELFARHLAGVEAWLKTQANIEVLYVDYRRVIAEPHAAAQEISQFVGGSLDVERMARTVDESLYRRRSG
ncbi:MAG: sulfatase-like hydrolase/transferase [Pseudomonadota bacterium]